MSLYSDEQRKALLLTEQVASAFSLVGCAFVIVTFLASSRFRKPVNRLIFYAVWGNVLFNISTLISLNGPAAGATSPLCQFQGFMIQAFLPADALWNLTMAINVYLTVFKNNDAARLRAREPYYIAFNYGVPFVIALAYCFISTPAQGKVYGPAILWCWVTTEWEIWRVITCYLIGWLCMVSAFTIYVLAGREIFRKRCQLRAFSDLGPHGPKRRPSHPSGGPASPGLRPWSPARGAPDRDGRGIRVTSEITKFSSTHAGAAGLLAPDCYHAVDRAPRERAAGPFAPYSVTIEYGDAASARSSRAVVPTLRQRNKAMEANTAAWGYTKCCILFFLSMLVTWVPSSVNRVYALAHPAANPPFALSYVAGLVLPLTGFWNSVIYVTTSRAAVRALFAEDLPACVRGRPRARPGSPASYSTREHAPLRPSLARSLARASGDSMDSFGAGPKMEGRVTEVALGGEKEGGDGRSGRYTTVSEYSGATV